MRPPSYYKSLANNNSISSRNSSQKLRSSFSSSSSSSYVSRTHLPFVPQSTLVAHCFTGAGSTTRPYGQTSGYSLAGSTSYGGSNRSYTASSYTASRPQSTKRNPYLAPTPTSSAYGYTSSSSSSPRYQSSSGSSSSYRPSASALSSYYTPIRLRERPVLTQISRQLNSRVSAVSHSSPRVSTTTSRTVEENGDKSEEKRLSEEPASEKEPDDKDVDWQADVARNISRNKYLIKFREFDKRGSISPSPQPVIVDEPSVPLEEKVDASSGTEMKTQPLVEPRASATLELAEPKSDTSRTNADNCDTSRVEQETEASKTPAKKKAPTKERRNIKLKIKTPNSTGGDADKAAESGAKTDVALEPPSPVVRIKKKPASGGRQDSDAPTKTKVKRLIKTSASKAALADLPKSSSVAATDEPQAVKIGERKSLAPIQVEPPKTVEKLRQQPAAVEVEPKQPPSSSSSPATSTNKRIRFREYHIGDFNFLSVLGHGGWGFVVLAELKQHDACFAVKCIKKITIVEDDDFDSIMIERKVLTLGNIHPFICKLFCTFETEGYLFFVMEYCAGGDLMFHVQREGKFTESRCRFYAAEIICAIRFLHNRHIIYRDLKLDNILLDSSGHIRLVDFGMCQCRTYREEMLPSNFCGTPEYISPEIIKGVPYNHSVDWWSFGVLLYEMAVGKMPFRGGDENELLWNVCYEQIHYPMFLTKELTSLLQALLEREPAKRMGMATCKAGDIYDQPWFRGVDWPAVEALKVPPPFVPEVSSKRDVQNFDTDFTESAPELSPVEADTLARIDQSQFQKFPYTNPEIAIFG